LKSRTDKKLNEKLEMLGFNRVRLLESAKVVFNSNADSRIFDVTFNIIRVFCIEVVKLLLVATVIDALAVVVCNNLRFRIFKIIAKAGRI
jgi:hypothetical protein